jgi:hypothetical protein
MKTKPSGLTVPDSRPDAHPVYETQSPGGVAKEKDMKKDLIEEVKETLNLTDERNGHLTWDAALPVLRRLAADVQKGQRAIGMVLWHLDPTPAELAKCAEDLQVEPATLKSWLNTYSRLRKDAELAGLGFSMQKQLARIMNAEDREQLWTSRPADEWELSSLTAAVDLYMDSIGSSVMPRTKKAGCKARFDEREVKVNLELMEDSVFIKLAVSKGTSLDGIKFERLSEGLYQVKFDW